MASLNGSSGEGATGAAEAAQRLSFRSIVLGRRLRPIWICTGILFGLFSLVRVGLLISRYGQLAGHFGTGEILKCLLLGVRHDAIPIGYAIAPLVVALALASRKDLDRRAFRGTVLFYAAAVVTVFVGTELFGIYFFGRFGRRLNYMAFAYLTQAETLVFMWNNYPIWGLIPVIPAVFYLCYRLLSRWFGRGVEVWWTPPRRVVAAAALLGLCVLACRGGLRSEPLRRGSAYFSQNQLIGQLAMNNFYTMFYAARNEFTDGQYERDVYKLPTPARAAAVASELLLTADDEPLGHPGNPLWRRSRSPLPRRDLNVVLIIMEGMAGRPVGALGYSPSHTPRLDELCREGLFFERMYAVGARTSRGMVGVLCGHPDIGGTSLMRRPRAIGRFFTLPEVFRRRGYHTVFLCGGQSTFDNMGEFLGAGGIDEVIDQDQMDGKPGNWGVPDEVLFQKAHERFEELAEQPFFATILTTSNHDPFEVPPGRCEMLPAKDNKRNRMLNAYRYSDWALGEFFRSAREGRYFDNTLFVLVSDHGRQLDQTRMVDVPGFRVPCLFYAPGLIAPDRVATIASQTDIPPTLLGMLGGETEHCFLGRDVLGVADDDGFALLHEDVYLAFVRGDFALALPPGTRRDGILFKVGASGMRPVDPNAAPAGLPSELAEQMLSYYTMARHLYERGAYCPPDRYVEPAVEPPALRPPPKGR